MPPFRIAIRNENHGHPNYAWFAWAKTFDTPEEAEDEGMPRATDYYPVSDGYIHRVEELVKRDDADDTAYWREVK